MSRRATSSRHWLIAAGLAACALACDRPDPRPRGITSSDPVPEGAQRIGIEATAEGFVPAEARVEQGRPAVLTFTRTVESSCVDAVKMPWRDQPWELPLNQPVTIVIPDTSKAGEFTYSCWMDMVHGKVVIHGPPAP